MDSSRYWPPPNGVRSRRALENGDFTARNPETGPYGSSLKCLPRERSNYMRWWRQATLHMEQLLWGDHSERQSAKERIDQVNEEIRAFNITCNRNEECGTIDGIDWIRAGRQLDLAVRDKCFYNSTARFEDVRDFIWERIQNRTYPEAWEVTWYKFEDKIRKRSSNFENIRNGNDLDIQDGAYRFYENPMTSSPSVNTPSSSIPRRRSARHQNRHGPLSVQGGGISRRGGAELRLSHRRHRLRLEELETQLASPGWKKMETLR
ncbi:hypothetical protein TSTA_084460 [Talaromyces stipitatus ATCC 10500]|uniref:Uncharacterized protein n=1 Tax=Talaromyces stipitatus (strain ATCC 10500 / CBS 375.48 / QM 6759 / NRRL 1006) TaxID=441959 RepID=B8M0B8_TALSN|nr:uncharacterized protein TSTA_084460 [Talaromyces stipitatus ATCC 10500]EED21215.1 hypothetical protein TSTA_084460 [Talaromyces stipitatus ATCC 10500]